MTESVTVVREQVPGPPGPSVQSGVVAAGSPTLPIGYAFVTVAGGVRVADTIGLAANPVPSGVAASSGSAGTNVYLAVAGVRPASETGLGPGVSSAVGVNSSGKLVRSTDPTCVPGLYVGDCNTVGDLTINVRESLSENVGDGRFALTTLDANPSTIATISVANETIVAIEAYCEAKLVGSGTCAIIAKRDVYVRTGSGAPTQVDPVEVLTKRPTSTPYDVTFVISGNSVLVKVTGAANVKWTAEVKALKLTDG